MSNRKAITPHDVLAPSFQPPGDPTLPDVDFAAALVHLVATPVLAVGAGVAYPRRSADTERIGYSIHTQRLLRPIVVSLDFVGDGGPGLDRLGKDHRYRVLDFLSHPHAIRWIRVRENLVDRWDTNSTVPTTIGQHTEGGIGVSLHKDTSPGLSLQDSGHFEQGRCPADLVYEEAKMRKVWAWKGPLLDRLCLRRFVMYLVSDLRVSRQASLLS